LRSAATTRYLLTVLLRCWFGFVAVACGVSVAWLVDGKSLPFVWLLAAFGILTAATFAPQRLKPHHHPTFRSRRAPADVRLRHVPEQPAPRPRQRGQSDQELVAELLGALRPDDVTQLQREDFSGAWHSRQIEPCERLLDIGSTLPRLSDREVAGALHTLLERTADFLEYHERHTVSDPVVGSPDWRIVAEPGEHAGGARNGSTRAVSPSVELRERAAEIARAYDHLLEAASRSNPVASEAPAPNRPVASQRSRLLA
jgi:hypothetical protein